MISKHFEVHIYEQDAFEIEINLTLPESKYIVATVLLSKAPMLIPRMLSLNFIEVDDELRRLGCARRLLQVARKIAADKGFDGVVPHSDLSHDGASFWEAVDPKALRCILRHEGARQFAVEHGCDPEKFDAIFEAFA